MYFIENIACTEKETGRRSQQATPLVPRTSCDDTHNAILGMPTQKQAPLLSVGLTLR